MASSSDWIAHAAAPDVVRASMPHWIAALGAGAIDAGGEGAAAIQPGFRDISPFAPAALPDPPPPPPEPGPSAAERAHARGLAEGRAEAASAAEAELAAERARFASLRLAFRRLDAAATEALAQDLNATVLALCEGVLGEYAHDAEALLTRCQRAAQRLGAGPASTGGEPALTLHLHPDTRARIDPAELAGWALADDPALDPGALRLTGERGAVRDSPADWMRAIAEALGA